MKNKKLLIAIIAALVVIAAVLLIWQPWKTAEKPAESAKVKLGVILLHDEDSTYDNNFINGVKDAQKKLGLSDDQVIIKRNVPESNECYEAAKDLVDEGCTIVFADSFGHESFMLQAAKDFPNVEFCHATGTTAHTGQAGINHHITTAIFQKLHKAHG